VICGTRPELKDSDHYFFRLSAFSGKLRNWLEKSEVQSDIKNYVLSWIEKGLEDWCVSRDSPYFGFRIPGEKDKYFYVWLDAPIGYIASTANYCRKNGCDALADYWKAKGSKIIHFIGKDIAYFHLIFWPAVLMGAGFRTPDNVVVHGFLTVNKEKMSKSRGTFITGREYLERLDPEFLRYHYASNLTRTTGDIDLSFEEFGKKINTELVGNIANFCYRTLSFVEKYGKGSVKRIENNQRDMLTLERVNEKIRLIDKKYQDVAFREVMKHILEISDIGNRYFQENEPWNLVKTDQKRAGEVLTVSANIVKKLAIVLKPILPKFSENLEKQLNLKSLEWKDLYEDMENHRMGKPEILFRKIEKIDFTEPFSSLDLKVARIEKVEDHPEADKLYVLRIDLGTEKRTLVAGLKGHYSKNELEGKNIVVLTNLKPVSFRGVESKGMILAADDGKQVGLLLSREKPGTDVSVEGVTKRPANEINMKDLLKLGLESRKGKVYYGKKVLKTGKSEISADRNVEGKVR
jgi:methionyl-tRNA synthetase